MDRRQSRPRWWWWLAALTLLGAAAWWWLEGTGTDDRDAAEVHGKTSLMDLLSQVIPGEFRPIQPPGQTMGAEPRPLPQLRQALRQGVLKDTLVPEGWCTVGELLRPCPTLRERFDHYLHALGEISPAEVRMLVADDAQQALGARQAAQVLDLFDRYWQVYSHEFVHELEVADPQTVAAALQERKQMREQALGTDWAQAFFADEDRFAQALARGGIVWARSELSNDLTEHDRELKLKRFIRARLARASSP